MLQENMQQLLQTKKDQKKKKQITIYLNHYTIILRLNDITVLVINFQFSFILKHE